MRVKVNGRTWTMKELHVYGSADHETQEIHIEPGQTGRTRLDTVIHEFVHAIRPEFRESVVEELAEGLTKALWADGWRRKRGH